VELLRDPQNEENGKGSKRKPEKQNQSLPSMKLGHQSFPRNDGIDRQYSSVEFVYNGTIYLFIETVKPNYLMFRGLDMPNSNPFVFDGVMQFCSDILYK
jgi:hypothetical protein